MPKRTKSHVTRYPNGSWQAKAEGASRASAVSKTKTEAADRARELAKSQPLEQVVIHESDGNIPIRQGAEGKEHEDELLTGDDTHTPLDWM